MVTLILLWGTMSLTAFGFVTSVLVRVVLLVIAAGVTVHILRMRTVTPEMLGALEEPDEEK